MSKLQLYHVANGSLSEELTLLMTLVC